ncbi:hypothetical protein CTAYLR_000756 [Chrysophaeum taylorii]|uniref:RING-type domain-containing protein n=1 Tax=Chrysophaeum taylorii TaxID=2483200 RepID=A0AAD7XNQ0_9STRA|nr:hypothetical protein CTAYLR_000756 [Chrysophaeum taylorii]
MMRGHHHQCGPPSRRHHRQWWSWQRLSRGLTPRVVVVAAVCVCALRAAAAGTSAGERRSRRGVKITFGSGSREEAMAGWQPLHVAARNGYGRVVDRLAKTTDVNSATPAGDTALHVAARYGMGDVARQLALGHHADLQSRNREGLTPVVVAALAGHANVVEALADASRLGDLDSVAYVAAEAGQASVIRSLARAGANLSRVQPNGWTAASAAASNGHAAVVAELGRAGATLSGPSSSDVSGESGFGNPAWLAALNNYHDVIDALAAFVDLNAISHPQNGWTPTHLAVEKGHLETIKALARHGVDLNRATHDSYAPAHRAAYLGRADVLAVLLDAGVDPDRRTSDGATPTFVAAQHDWPEIIALLAARGADINLPKNDGATPASVAAQAGHADVVSVLAAVDAELDEPADGTYAPVHLAAYFGRAHVVDAMAAVGVDLNKATRDGWTPAHVAAQRGHANVVAALARSGADLSRGANGGTTPVYMAAQFGHVDVIMRLAEAGVDLDAKDHSGWTPQQFAKRKGMRHVLDALARGRALQRDDAFKTGDRRALNRSTPIDHLSNNATIPAQQQPPSSKATASSSLDDDDGDDAAFGSRRRRDLRCEELASVDVDHDNNNFLVGANHPAANVRGGERRWAQFGCLGVLFAILSVAVYDLLTRQYCGHADAAAPDESPRGGGGGGGGEQEDAERILLVPAATQTGDSPVPTARRKPNHVASKRPGKAADQDDSRAAAMISLQATKCDELAAVVDMLRRDRVSEETKFRAEADKWRALTDETRRELADERERHAAVLRGLQSEVAAAEAAARTAQSRANEAEERASECEHKALDLRTAHETERDRLARALDQTKLRVEQLLHDQARARGATADMLCEIDVSRLPEETLAKVESKLPGLQLSVTREILRREMRKSQAGNQHSPDASDLASECIVCLAGAREVAFGCGHLCVCNDCAYTVEACPVCREVISERRRIFSS